MRKKPDKEFVRFIKPKAKEVKSRKVKGKSKKPSNVCFTFVLFFCYFLLNELISEEKQYLFMPVELEDRGKALEDEYFRKKEQELIAKMKAKLDAESKEASALKCPKCEGNLVETNFEHIKIDVCNKCHGVWLDAGELAQITHKDETGWFGRLFG